MEKVLLLENCVFTNYCSEKEYLNDKRKRMNLRFFYCRHCGKILVMIHDSGTPTICCGDDMTEIIPKQEEMNHEKHVPVINENGSFVTVTVGSTMHPSTKDHYIQWILLETDRGYQTRVLNCDEEPVAKFVIAAGEKILGAYSYCNIHGLWKSI